MSRQRTTGLALWHYVVFALALVTTITAYSFSSAQAAMRAEEHFQREVSQITGLLRERMSTYEDALRAGVAAIAVADREITAQDWRRFERTLDLGERYPGINGIGVITRVPEAEMPDFLARRRVDQPDFDTYPTFSAPVHFPITFIEPLDINRAAVGLDIAFEGARLAAMQRAEATNTTQMTAPIVLVQDDRDSPGFLLYAPLFRTDADGERRFAGAVYAPFIMERLIEGTLGRDFRSVLIEIGDGDAPLYSESETGRHMVDPDPMFADTVDIAFYGRDWSVRIETTSGFRAMNGSAAPSLVLLFGLMVEAALLLLFVGLHRANRAAVQLAEYLTEELRVEKRELEVSNIALERYNYLSSHDLRTPLRGMHDVASELRHDISGRLSGGTDPVVSGHLDDLGSLIGEMDTLIGGMVAFSQVGRTKDDRALIPTRGLLARIIGDHAGSGATITLSGTLPQVYCNPELLDMIVSNLVSNAVAHHPNRTAANIAVMCTSIGHNLVLQVTDDGAGIPVHLQPQLFDRMRKIDTLGQRIPKTGLGLAMVKRAANAIGGYVTLTSQPGTGSCFTAMLLNIVDVDPRSIAPPSPARNLAEIDNIASYKPRDRNAA